MDTTRIEGARNKGIVALLALALVALVVAVFATGTGADEHDHVDGPVGVDVEPLVRGAFTDEVAAQFELRYDEHGEGADPIVMDLEDAGEVVVAKVTFAPEGTLGWHTHPGSSVVNIVEGELEVTNADDCLSRTYGAGEAWIDPGQGNVHTAVNPSTEEDTVVYVTFFGVPEDEPATEHVAAESC